MGPFLFFRRRKSFHVCFHTRLKTIYPVQYQNSHCGASLPSVTQPHRSSLLLSSGQWHPAGCQVASGSSLLAGSRISGGVLRTREGTHSVWPWGPCVSPSAEDLLKAPLVYFPFRFLQWASWCGTEMEQALGLEPRSCLESLEGEISISAELLWNTAAGGPPGIMWLVSFLETLRGYYRWD